MRKIFKIALTELCTLFYSPIAWLVLIIFTVQACMTYFRLVDIMLMQQFNKPLWYSIAKEMYTGNMGLFPNMLVHLYLYIPLLTMGLMSREYSSVLSNYYILHRCPAYRLSSGNFFHDDIQPYSGGYSLFVCWVHGMERAFF